MPPEEPFADNDNNYLFELDNDNMEVWRNLVFYAKNCNPIPEVKMSLDGNLLGNNIVTTDTLQFNDTDPNKPRAPTVLTAKTTLNITIKVCLHFEMTQFLIL